jgi:hypothetical protein
LLILSDVTSGCLSFASAATGVAPSAREASNGAAAAAETVPAMNFLRLRPLVNRAEGWDMTRSWLAGVVR